MSREHEILMCDVRTEVALQGPVIRRLADELVEEVIRLHACVDELESERHPMDAIRRVVPVLRAMAARFGDPGNPRRPAGLGERLRACAAILTRRHDRVLTETQPIIRSESP